MGLPPLRPTRLQVKPVCWLNSPSSAPGAAMIAKPGQVGRGGAEALIPVPVQVPGGAQQGGELLP